MAGLLVSVRSAEEAKIAVEGGASVIDVKEPIRGPLGRASVETWRAVRQVVPPSIPVSVALGELRDWDGGEPPTDSHFRGISFRKLGLAGAGPDWQADWTRVRRLAGGESRWVAVAYADWRVAEAPEPIQVLEAALEIPECSGILVDTWDKTKPSPIEATSGWLEWVGRARRSGRFVALAGGMGLPEINRLGSLRPDLFAVRGAACNRADRRGAIHLDRVAELVRALHQMAILRPGVHL